MKYYVIVICCLWAHLCTAAETKIHTIVSILPQEYFVSRIGADRVEVHALVTPGKSPATYDPTPQQMAEIAEAALFFRIGVPFENSLIPKIQGSMPHLRIIDTRKNITLRTMRTEHHHGSTERTHNAKDPHIWMSPQLAIQQSRTIADALITYDPQGKHIYEKNYAALKKDLLLLDAELRQALLPLKGKTFLVFHPILGYFADAYGLHQEAIESDGKDSSARHLARIIEQAKSDKIHVVFVQPQFSTASAQKIARAINGIVLPIDPLARDYLHNLRHIATIFSKNLSY